MAASRLSDSVLKAAMARIDIRRITRHPGARLGAVLALSVAALPLAAPARELPQRMEATFVLEAAGTKFAATHWTLAPGDGDTYISTSRTEPRGLFALIHDETRYERSEWTYSEDWLQPLAYHYERTGRKSRQIDITFDWQENVAHYESHGTSWQLKVPPGTMDKLNHFLALMRDLGRGARHVKYTIADSRRRLTDYVFSEIGEASVDTALGTLEAVVVRREHEDRRRRTTFWCARALGYFPVKIVHDERDGTPLTLRIESLSGIERRES